MGSKQLAEIEKTQSISRRVFPHPMHTHPSVQVGDVADQRVPTTHNCLTWKMGIFPLISSKWRKNLVQASKVVRISFGKQPCWTLIPSQRNEGFERIRKVSTKPAKENFSVKVRMASHIKTHLHVLHFSRCELKPVSLKLYSFFTKI